METTNKSYAINNKDVLAKISEAERMVIDAEYQILDQKIKILDAEDNHMALLIQLSSKLDDLSLPHDEARPLAG